MKLLRILTIVIAVLLGAGEVARWWGDVQLVPLAFDELAVAAALLWAALSVKRYGTAPLAAAWGVYCGLMLALLVQTADHLLGGPPKESAQFYTAVLAVMLLVGVWGVWRALRLTQGQSPER